MNVWKAAILTYQQPLICFTVLKTLYHLAVLCNSLSSTYLKDGRVSFFELKLCLGNIILLYFIFDISKSASPAAKCEVTASKLHRPLVSMNAHLFASVLESRCMHTHKNTILGRRRNLHKQCFNNTSSSKFSSNSRVPLTQNAGYINV